MLCVSPPVMGGAFLGLSMSKPKSPEAQYRAIHRHRNERTEALDTIHQVAHRKFPNDICFARSAGEMFLALLKQDYSIDVAVTRVTNLIARH